MLEQILIFVKTVSWALWDWGQKNLFSSWTSAVLTVLGGFAFFTVISTVLDWAVFRAVWHGEGREDCLGEAVGACWPFIEAKWNQIIYGQYPLEEQWRPRLVFWMGVLGLFPLLVPQARHQGKSRLQKLLRHWPRFWNTLFMLFVFPVVAVILLRGGLLGLKPVPTPEWGGLLLTLVLATSGITLSLPVGILLALGRRSSMFFVRIFCVAFIEFWRGIPLITVLFTASFLFPLFLPHGVSFDTLLRCGVGITLFSAAYMAEVIRGGLQAVPLGQVEAARAVGLGYGKTTRLIVLPQALRHVIPGIVNTFIGLFKDTTLITTVALFDVLGIVQRGLADVEWATPQSAWTGYFTVAVIFWIWCFGLSRYSIFMERQGKRRV